MNRRRSPQYTSLFTLSAVQVQAVQEQPVSGTSLLCTLSAVRCSTGQALQKETRLLGEQPHRKGATGAGAVAEAVAAMATGGRGRRTKYH